MAYKDFNAANGRYVDLNHNEVDYIPPFVVRDTGPLEESLTDNRPAPAKPPRSFATLLDNPYSKDRAQKIYSDLEATQAQDCRNIKRISSCRTPVVNLQQANLDFLKFPFEIPPLGVDQTQPFLTDFLNGTIKKSTLLESLSRNDQDYHQQISGHLSDDSPKLATSKLVDDLRRNDIGQGPDHIEDWDSLATLLPNSVVKTCQFFRQNSSIFRGGSIDKPAPTDYSSKQGAIFSTKQRYLFENFHVVENTSPRNCPNRTIFSGNCENLPPIYEKLCLSDVTCCKKCSAHYYRNQMDPCSSPHCNFHKRFNCCHCCCCCRSDGQCDDRLERWTLGQLSDLHSRSLHAPKGRSLNVKTLGSIDLKICEEKMKLLAMLVDKIIRCVSDIDASFQSVNRHADVDLAINEGESWPIGTAVFDSLCPALECLLTDGLKNGKTICDVMKTSTDGITQSVCGLVVGGNSSHKVIGNNRERSLKFAVFIDGLLSSKSLALWIENLISSEHWLAENYAETAYIRLLSCAHGINLMGKLKNNFNNLANLPFEKISLVDVEIDVNENTPNLGTGQSPTTGRCNSFVKRGDDQIQAVQPSSFVVFQKELRIIFRFPAKVLLHSPSRSTFRVETDKDTVLHTNSNKKNLMAANESRIPRNISGSGSAFRLDSLQASPASNSPPASPFKFNGKLKTSHLKSVDPSPPTTPLKTQSRIPLPSYRTSCPPKNGCQVRSHFHQRMQASR